jgi:hypothetical protein
MTSRILVPRSARALFEVRIGNVLLPHEKVAWSGQPDVELAVKSTWIFVAFGTFWTGFSVLWTVLAFRGVITHLRSFADVLSLLPPLFGLPFIAIGLIMLSSPYLVARFTKKVFFVVTNMRALIVNVDKLPDVPTPQTNGKRWAFTAYWPHEMFEPERIQHAGTCYELTFTRSPDSEGHMTKAGFTFLTSGMDDAERSIRSLLRRHRG